jgi:hypothetical protein
MPYTQIDDASWPNCGLRNRRDAHRDIWAALIYASYDSPKLPMSQLLARYGREHELQSQGWRTSTTNSKGPRPVILFPKEMGIGKQFACLMGTFEGGYIHHPTTRQFACGVWPIITDALNGLGSHIHTTPRWELYQKLPQFVLAIEYEPDDYGKPWDRSAMYHLDAGTTNFLHTLCTKMREKWSDQEDDDLSVSACRVV